MESHQAKCLQRATEMCVCAETPLAQMIVYAVGSHVEIQRVTVITGKTALR